MEVNSTGDLQAAASDNAENNIANTEEEIKANGENAGDMLLVAAEENGLTNGSEAADDSAMQNSAKEEQVHPREDVREQTGGSNSPSSSDVTDFSSQVAEVAEDAIEQELGEKVVYSQHDDVGALNGDDSFTRAVKATMAPAKRQLSSVVVDIDQLARCQNSIEDVPEVKSFTIALLELAFEKQTDVASTAVITLQKLGHRHPSTVLRTLHAYLSSETKPATRVRATVLTVMQTTINPAIEAGHLDANLAANLISLALEEMVFYTEPTPDVQLPASNILVSIGAVYCKDVVQLLCSRLNANTLPHPSILVSLGDLATLNIYATVPHLKGVLDGLVALLATGQVKSSTLRCSSATALAKFSEALLFYLANMERAPDSSVQREWFIPGIAEAFEILFIQWLPCKVPLTCQEILEALGQMSQLLPLERMEQVATKLLPCLVQSYRGPVEPLYVSRCLALFLDSYFQAGLQLADFSTQEMLQALFLQMIVQPDYGQPTTVKNHYEVLRCLERIARVHLDKVVSFLLVKAEQPTEKIRVAALTVLKHLLNSLKDLLEPHVAAIGAQIKLLTLDPGHQSNAVKKALVQVIVAMAVQGHLLASDTVHSGRHVHLIAFLLKLCTLVPGAETSPTSPTALSEAFRLPLNRSDQTISAPVTNDELKQMCENVIHLLVTTQVPMEGLFWPLLLRYSLDAEYCRAMGVISRALAHLVGKKRPETSNLVTLDTLNDGSTATIVARFLGLARSPHSEKCLVVLSFLKSFASLVHPSLDQLWQAELPSLVKQLKANVMEQSENQDNWLASLENLVHVTVGRMKVASPEWTKMLASSFFDQTSLYEFQPLERGFLLSLIGICVHNGVVSQGPSYALDFVMANVRHQHPEESLGCASAMGWCARSHLDVALLRLQNLERNDYGRKSSGFLGFMKESRSEAEAELLKITAVRCFARIATDTPPTELLLKVDKHIIRAIVYVLQTSKDLLVRQEGLDAIACVAKALFPERLQERYLLAGRPDLLKETLMQLKAIALPDHLNQLGSAADLQRLVEATRFAIRALAALAALVRLPPALRVEDQSILLEAALERCIPMYAKLCRYAKEECWVVDASLAANQLLMAIENFTLHLLRSCIDPSCVDIIFSQLLPWTKGQEEAMRRAALTLLKLVYTTFLQEVEFEPGAPTRFSQGHIMIAKIVPRCTDPDGSVRDLAIDCLALVLDIVSKYHGYSRDYEKPTTDKLESLKKDLGLADPSVPLTELANLLNAKTPPSDLWAFLESMAVGLADPFQNSSSGMSLVMCLVLKMRGGEIHLRVKDLLDVLLSRLKSIDCQQTRRSILNGVCLLASHQRETVASSLLSHSLPHNEDISDCWKALAADSNLSSAILDHLTDILSHAAPYEERGAAHANEAIVSCRLLSCVSAIKSMTQVPELCGVFQGRFPQLFCLLVLAQSCVLGASPPIHFPSASGDQLSFVPVNREAYRLNPYQMTVEALKSFLNCTQMSTLAQPLSEHRHATNSGDPVAFCDLVANITALMCTYATGELTHCVSFMGGALKSSHHRHRLAAVAFYSELIHQGAGGRNLDSVIRGLTSVLPDQSHLIRRMALKGLGSLGDSDPRHWATYAPEVLNALMDGLEEDGRDHSDQNSGTAKEALEGLMRLIPFAPLPEVERLASRLALRVRPFFEHEQPQVRHAAVSLLAHLFKAGATTSARTHLAEQVHATLTSLLLHLNESDESVIRACKAALRQAGPLLEESGGQINAMFQTHLPDQGRLNYSAFLTDLVKLMAVDFEDWMSSTYLPAAASYFKSSSPELRSNAALYVGLLCGVSQSTSSQHRNVTLALTRLLHDPVKPVRLQAMNAISLMFG